MHQTISDILQRVLRGRSELHTLLYGSGPIDILMSLFLLGITTVFVLTVFRKSLMFKSSTINNGSQQVEKNGTTPNPAKIKKDRPFGEWNPVAFRYPSIEIEACPHPLKDVKPIPYRPFRWGAYHVTMGIRNMPWNDWIELDNEYEDYHRIKVHRIETLGERAVRVLGDDANPGIVRGGAEAAVELVHELAEYLSRRYPKDFSIVRHPQRFPAGTLFCDWGWEGEPPIKTVTMVSLGISYDLPLSVQDGSQAAEKAMEIAGLLIQEDLVIMIEGTDGKYYFQAGAICLPGFWRMQDKIGLRLDDIHILGNVPQYREKLGASLERFFRRIPVDKPVIRDNYFIQANVGEGPNPIDRRELAWAESTMGPEERFRHGSHGEEGNKEASGKVTVEGLLLRTERQTLRRLGRSGGVVFTVRTYLTPVTSLAEEEGVAGRLASALRSWPEDVGKYKGKERGIWWKMVVEYLDQIVANK
ncbi:hypothetical protein BYT27DRAFT_7109166 [Phlegmacium glaucopus]|nr:hypothetical protein BYT27DRAFT_7109166 [Phlegmacium glaucopus]